MIHHLLRPARPAGPGRAVRSILGAALIGGLAVVGWLAVDLARLSAVEPDRAEGPLMIPRPGGALVIGGGGRLPDEIKQTFLDLAGGASRARLVVIPTAHRIADSPNASVVLEDWKGRGVESVQLFHTRSREQANDPEFVRPLAEATAVWFGGGVQSELSRAYVGTEVERQLTALLARGGVIGGSSAGAAIMTRVMIARGRTEAVVEQGFDLLPGAVVDQHFLRRNRMKRLQGLLARHPTLIGFGIDEGTALVVRGREARVMGSSYVVACTPAAADRPSRLEILKNGDTVDLASLAGLPDARAAEAPAVIPALELQALGR